MTADRLSREEQMEASRQAQNIQRTINTAAGRRLVRCVAPIIRMIRPGDVSEPGQVGHYGVELRIEPLVTIADIRHEPSRTIAATLREWAAFLEQAAASLE
jgi:hypothetical protein